MAPWECTDWHCGGGGSVPTGGYISNNPYPVGGLIPPPFIPYTGTGNSPGNVNNQPPQPVTGCVPGAHMNANGVCVPNSTPSLGQPPTAQPQIIAGVDNTTLLLIGGGAIALILLTR